MQNSRYCLKSGSVWFVGVHQTPFLGNNKCKWLSEEFKDKTTAINQIWQTDFTYFKIIGWGCYYLATILDDYSRYIIAWKLCTTMRASDVTETIELALAASGCDYALV